MNIKHELKIKRKRIIFGLNAWQVLKITHFGQRQKISQIYKGMNLNKALKFARDKRTCFNNSILIIEG
jgi:hypothetical protein